MEMFCPKCSQMQASEDVRFCSRCGFQMHVVAHLLETNGTLAEFEPKKPGKPPLYWQIISSAGAKVTFISVVLFICTFIFALFANAPEFLVIPLLIFVVGVTMTVYKILFGNVVENLRPDFDNTKNLNSVQSHDQLPPMHTKPVSFYESPRRTTGEMRQPPSVTEPTTKLLEQEEGKTNDL